MDGSEIYQVLIKGIDVSEDLVYPVPEITRSDAYVDDACFNLLNVDGKYAVGSHENFWNANGIDVKDFKTSVQIFNGESELIFDGLLIQISHNPYDNKARLVCADAEQFSKVA